MKILVYDWSKDIIEQNIERPTQKYEYFNLLITKYSLIKLYTYLLVPDNCNVIKYRCKNKWKLVYKEFDFPKFPDLKIDMQYFEQNILRHDLNWIGTLEEDSGTFFINPYFVNQDTINLVISKIQGE